MAAAVPDLMGQFFVHIPMGCASAAAPARTVTYDDGDAEDLYEYELRKILRD